MQQNRLASHQAVFVFQAASTRGQYRQPETVSPRFYGLLASRTLVFKMDGMAWVWGIRQPEILLACDVAGVAGLADIVATSRRRSIL